jgi:hypothetical protein
MRMLDLFCGRWGWSKAFAARGWECVGVDLVEPPSIPDGCIFFRCDILKLEWSRWGGIDLKGTFSNFEQFDFICASPPCEQFSVHGMKHFHPNPPYPELGIRLFEHTRKICTESGIPFVMENVRVAQQFVGNAVHHCGPFYLWGTGVPPLIPRDIRKLMSQARDRDANGKRIYAAAADRMWSTKRKQVVATIPPELANCVADYAERIIEQKLVDTDGRK